MLIMILFIMLYTMAGGAAGRQVHALGQSKCKGHKGEHDWEHCGHFYTGILAGTFWPLALPLAVGMKTSEKVPTPINKEITETKKREKEIARVQHEAQLEQAELMRDEMLNKRLELNARQMETRKKIMELESAGVPNPDGDI